MAGLVIPAYLVILPIQAFPALVVFLVGRVIPVYLATRVYLVIVVYQVTQVLAGKRVKQQLQDLLQTTGEQAHQVADTLRPLEDQLEQLLDDLNTTLRPRIEKPVREKPLMAIGIAAGVGLLFGLLLSGRRSA